MKKPLTIKPFSKNEAAEQKFWNNIDLTKHFSKEDFVPVSFPNLKPSSRSISLRIPEYILMRVKEQANELNVPYQSLMKQYIAHGVTH
ncbi:MAG: BrnA antitoxin family protein [Patescibacteria group bacterium]|jgi:predicted DNA binding CopG/RHH family protein